MKVELLHCTPLSLASRAACRNEDIRGLCSMLEVALRQAELLAAEAEIAAEGCGVA